MGMATDELYFKPQLHTATLEVLERTGIKLTHPKALEILALDLIHKVGPGGHYLQEAHTLKHFRKIRYSEIFERSVMARWEANGAKRFEDRLQEVTLKKMAHRPEPLAEGIVTELDRMQASWK